MKRAALIFGILLLSACRETPRNDRYSLHSSSDGTVYRLNVETGEVAVIDPRGVRVIGPTNDPLGIRKAN